MDLRHGSHGITVCTADRPPAEFFGAILGFVKGLVLCIALCWVLSYSGIVIGRHTIEDSILAKFLLSLNYLTSIAVA